MKKSKILYVTVGKEHVPLLAPDELTKTAASLGITAVCVAIAEDDAVYGWWTLITGGMQKVFFMTVSYNTVFERFECRGPVVLYGFPILN